MRAKNCLYGCATALALGLAADAWAQPALEVPALSRDEREELRDLLKEFDPEMANPDNLPIIQQHWLLNQLREIAAVSLLTSETEELTVCDTVGDPHLIEDRDVIILRRLGASGNVMMEVVRDKGTPQASNPWTNPGGGNSIVLNPSITGKPHPTNPSFKKFTPEAVGKAHVNPHTGGTPTDHDFSLRRNARVPDAKCSNPDPLILMVPDQHPVGGRHGGHAVLD